MAVEIKVPDMGESVIEATIARWMKQEGEPVAAGEPVVELETDKINLEVGAQQAGVLQKITHPAGDTVQVGDVLALVAEGQAGAQKEPAPPVAAQPQAAQPSAAERTAPAQAPAQPAAQPAPAQEQAQPSQPVESPAGQAIPATVTPVAQRMAQELGIDLSQIKPSGAGGRITKEDVQAAYEARGAGQAGVESRLAAPATTPSPAPAAASPASAAPSAPARPAIQPIPANGAAAAGSTDGSRRETRQRMSRRRQTIAKRLVEAQHTAAMLTTFNEIDMSAVMELRKRRREGFKERYGVDLGFMSFFVKASIGALKAFPEVNAELQGEELVLKHYYDIGVAIGAEEGLVVPVIRDADRLNFAGIEKAIKDFVAKVKDSTLTLDDLRGGTFSITNGGVYGSLMSTPILNPPQVAILGMHAIKERPVVINGEIVVRPMMYVALSYDHRVVDGREAVQFLVRIKELVEDPESLLFG